MALAALPNWPARLSEARAAQFLEVSKTTFRARWTGGEYPKPVREGRRLFWSRLQLERFVAAQFNLGEAEEEDPTWADLN